MGQASAKLRLTTNGGLMYWCQGCEQPHVVQTGAGDGPRWGFDGDFSAPTFTPSVLVTRNRSVPPVTPENLDEWKRAPWPQEKVASVCHTFITGGMVQFLGDCTHALAGQTLQLPDLPPELTDR